MNIEPYLYQVRRWLLFAILPAIVVGVLDYARVDREPKIYAASTILFIRHPVGIGGPSSASDPTMVEAVIPTYTGIIQSPVVAAGVDRAMAARYPGYYLGGVSVSAGGPSTAASSQLMTITVTDTDPARAAVAANTVAQVFLKTVVQVQNAPLNGAITVFSPAYYGYGPIAPNPQRSAIVAMFVALLVCAAGLYVYDYVDDVLRTPEEIARIVRAPILGAVRRFNVGRAGTPLITVAQPRSALSEAYRIIRTNILFTHADKPPRTMLVTSPSRGEGKSTTASNLARVMAEGGHTVVLVDCDLRRPDLHKIFGLDQEHAGLSVLLAGHELDDTVLEQTDLPTLSVVWAGPIPPNPADLLGSQRMKEVVAQLSERADLVILDSAPILPVADAAILAAIVDGVVVVIDPKTSKRRELTKARETVEAVGDKVLGIVINRRNLRGSGYYYHPTYVYEEDESPKRVSLANFRRAAENRMPSSGRRKG